jgi:hypothetical protein
MTSLALEDAPLLTLSTYFLPSQISVQYVLETCASVFQNKTKKLTDKKENKNKNKMV